MEKTHITKTPLPTNTAECVEFVMATCVTVGYVNRLVLVQLYKLTPLQASILLREFLKMHVDDVRLDDAKGGYVLIRQDLNSH